MGQPTIHVQLREGQVEPPGLDSFEKVRRLPVTEWPLIVVFASGAEGVRERDEVLQSWAGLGYEVMAGETMDLDWSHLRPGEY